MGGPAGVDREGEAFAGRVAASLLQAIEMPELVTNNLAEYEALALELALDPARLAALKEKLARNIATTPLFDSASFARHIEAAYTAMYERYIEGFAPADIRVER